MLCQFLTIGADTAISNILKTKWVNYDVFGLSDQSERVTPMPITRLLRS